MMKSTEKMQSSVPPVAPMASYPQVVCGTCNSERGMQGRRRGVEGRRWRRRKMWLAVVTAFAREMRGAGLRLQPGPSHVTPEGGRGPPGWEAARHGTHTHTHAWGPTVTLHHDGTETWNCKRRAESRMDTVSFPLEYSSCLLLQSLRLWKQEKNSVQVSHFGKVSGLCHCEVFGLSSSGDTKTESLKPGRNRGRSAALNAFWKRKSREKL